MKNWNSDKTKGLIAGAVLTVLVVLLIQQVAFRLPVSSSVKKPDSVAAYNKINEIMSYIDKGYLGEVDKEQLADYMYYGLVSGLDDPYSTYYTKEEFEEISRGRKGEYKGIGIAVSNREDGALYISSVTENGPADRAGVLEDDVILKINGEDFENATFAEAAEFIRGLEKDDVELTVLRGSAGETFVLSMKRENLESYSVSYGMPEEGIGYIYISSFTAVTAKQFAEARNALEEQGMNSLIIDLRNNSGGLVTGVCDTLSNFIPEGDMLVYTENRDGDRREDLSSGGEPFEIPVVILINEETASAAEIFAGCVQDYGIGTLIGTVTFGKGVVQNTYPLSDGSVVKLTALRYFTPNGNNIHGVGITPDIEVENTETEDLQYLKAVEVLTENL